MRAGPPHGHRLPHAPAHAGAHTRPHGHGHVHGHTHTHTCSHAHRRMLHASSRTCSWAHTSTHVTACTRSGTLAAAATSGAEESICFSPNTRSHHKENRKGLGAETGRGGGRLAGSRLQRGGRRRLCGADRQTAAGERWRAPAASGPPCSSYPQTLEGGSFETWGPGPSRLRSPGL